MRQGALLLAALMLVGCSEAERQTPQPLPLTQKEQKIAEVLIQHRSPHPVELARVIAKMKRPRLAAAQAIVESNGNKNAIGTSKEKGVWQVIEREWGQVPADIPGQAKQYETIMEELIKKSQGDLRRALGRYNGDRSGRYAKKTMNLVASVKL